MSSSARRRDISPIDDGDGEPDAGGQHQNRTDEVARQLWMRGRPTQGMLLFHFPFEKLQTPCQKQPGSPLPPVRQSGQLAPHDIADRDALRKCRRCNWSRHER